MMHVQRLAGEFFARLEKLDEVIAATVAAGGCRHCEGPLHLHIPDDLGSDSGALGQGIGAERRVHLGYGAKRRGEGMLGLG